MRLDLYIQDDPVESIINAESIRVQLNNDTNDPSATGTVSTNTLELTIKGANLINQYIAQGLDGGTGVFEGLPARLEGEESGEILPLIDGYLDLADGSTELECDKATVKIVQRGANDWFEKRKDSFSYAYLASLPDGAAGKISPSDWVQVPYVVSTIPNTRDLAILAVSGFVMAAQLRTITKDLIEFGIESAGVFTTVPALIKLASYIAYLVILVIAIIKLIRQLFDLIIQPIKYHAGMRLQTLLEKGAEYLGLTFESSKFNDSFWQDVVIVPEKYQSFDDGTNSGVLGFKKPTPSQQTGYYNGTFGDVLEIAKKLWNAREIVRDGVITVERVDVNNSSASYTLPDLEILATRLNTDELKSNTSIRFSTDLSDTNTIDEFEGTFTDVIIEPLAVENKDMVLLKGFELIETGVARVRRKDTLTVPELFVSALVQLVAPLLNTVLKLTPKKAKSRIPAGGIQNLINNRIGMASISNDFFQVPKVVAMDIKTNSVDNKVKTTNATRINSDALYTESYYVNSFVPSSNLPQPNQWKKYQTVSPFTLCFEDYKKIRNNNLIFDSEGNECKIISLDWNPTLQEANAEYWKKEIYTRNLKETIFTPDGL